MRYNANKFYYIRVTSSITIFNLQKSFNLQILLIIKYLHKRAQNTKFRIAQINRIIYKFHLTHPKYLLSFPPIFTKNNYQNHIHPSLTLLFTPLPFITYPPFINFISLFSILTQIIYSLLLLKQTASVTHLFSY